jgi:hypothetical protein
MPELKACAIRVEPLARDAEPRKVHVLRENGEARASAE